MLNFIDLGESFSKMREVATTMIMRQMEINILPERDAMTIVTPNVGVLGLFEKSL